MNSDENFAVLTIGQLKALAHPFHARLSAAVGNSWMNDHLLSRGLPASAGDPGVLHGDFLAADGVYYPWKLVQSPDNRAIANLGQLKLCFDLPLTEDSESPPDGLPDLWEYAVVHANPPGGPWTDIGLIHAGNAAQAAADTGVTEPPNSDTQGGGSEGETPDWFTLTGNGVEDEAITETQTFTIKKGKSRIVVVGMVSDEYPGFTGDQSEWNDQLEWEITPSVGDTVEDSVNVNTLHEKWNLATDSEIALQGFSSAHLEKMVVINAPGEADVTVTVKLTVTNIGDANLPSTLMVGLVPVEVADNTFATGVDRFSKTAHSTDIGFQKNFWIMAPAGSPPSGVGVCENDTKIFIPVDESVELVIDADKTTPDPDTISLAAVDDPATPETDETFNRVSWHGDSADSVENVIKWKFGANEPEEDLLPIKVMTMKNRTVKVAVWPVNLPLHQPLFPTEALRLAFQVSLKSRLDEVFAYQTNAWFDVEVKTGVVFDYMDTALSGRIYTLKRGAKEKSMINSYRSGSAHINIYLIDEVDYYNTNPDEPLSKRIAGASYPRGFLDPGPYVNTAVVNKSLASTAYADSLSTISHEIGHLLVGPGHPNEYIANDEDSGGKAPLQSLALTDHQKRLMCSGNQAKIYYSRLLVKSEWDEAEDWLKAVVDGAGTQ